MGLPPLVRIPTHEPQDICAVLDGGACGILCPYIETVAQVRVYVHVVYTSGLLIHHDTRQLQRSEMVCNPKNKYISLVLLVYLATPFFSMCVDGRGSQVRAMVGASKFRPIKARVLGAPRPCSSYPTANSQKNK